MFDLTIALIAIGIIVAPTILFASMASSTSRASSESGTVLTRFEDVRRSPSGRIRSTDTAQLFVSAHIDPPTRFALLQSLRANHRDSGSFRNRPNSNRGSSTRTSFVETIMGALRHFSDRPRQIQPVRRIQVTNVTRQTILATAAEVADTAARRNKGLLGRNGLQPGEGMWILPGEAVHTIGMRFAIDLIYLDRDRHIRKIKRSVPPGRISACVWAHSVLELAAGTVLETKTHVGDQLELSPAAKPA